MTPLDLRTLRLALNFTGARMAAELCIHVRHYWRLEAGDRMITAQTAKLAGLIRA